MTWTQDPAPPIVWSIAGNDSGGGAGLSADARMAAAFGVHLCPVVSTLTAQNSQGVQSLWPVPIEQLRAQLQALASDLRPCAIKTGLLGSAAQIELLCEVVDQLRRVGPVALFVDPVLSASAGGADFGHEALLRAYREQLLPRADLITPNRREAERLLGLATGTGESQAMAAALQALGAASICITGGDELPAAHELAIDWLDSPLASGYLALPRLPSTHHHGTGCSFTSAAAAASARGFAMPDAVLLAKMATWCAVRDGYAAGAGAGPVRALGDFVTEPRAMPVMSFGAEALDASTLARWTEVLQREPRAQTPLGLYAITERVERVAELAAAGLPQIQLRIKREQVRDEQALRAAIEAAVQAVAGCPTRLWINDHWQIALTAEAQALHLGQEDWAALSPNERKTLLASGALLGLSSHSLWELARARGLAPHYIACGPVWPTTTKSMPWQAQGMDNLAWWVHMAGCPVVAIGGILTPEQVQACAEQGAAAVCLVRALEQEPKQLPLFQAAFEQGLNRPVEGAIQPPHPALI
ncbi:bifunctional hydroxymethylpyrimidine kinase/phosphomethylpyrimidine kinase [Paucibacter sp. AS339]|uniref:bifunctional hydroxymethylpyrimidine kinase/phosphomethylpyrimidine kinase n=1 Tax=Paucibacter hankyongi TaxID=3133434 RepID=UPI0030B3E538